MFRHILVPLDGSARAEQALPVAARLARASQGTVTLLQVIDLTHDALSYGIEAPVLSQHVVEDTLSKARDYLSQQRHSHSLESVVVQERVISGNPAEEIIAQAAEPPIDLVVLSSHGYTGIKRWLLGSVAEKVARHAQVPVLILRDKEPLRTHQNSDGLRIAHALVPLDTSPRSLDALAPAAELVAALSTAGQGKLHLVQIVALAEKTNTMEREELLQAANQNLDAIGQSIRDGLVARFGAELHPALSWSVSITDDIAEGIVQMAESGKTSGEAGKVPASDVIVLTTHGSGSLYKWPFGSVAERVLHATRLPILLVRPEDVLLQARQQRRQQAEAVR